MKPAKIRPDLGLMWRQTSGRSGGDGSRDGSRTGVATRTWIWPNAAINELPYRPRHLILLPRTFAASDAAAPMIVGILPAATVK